MSWSSLEIAKLAVSALTPLVVALTGYWITAQLRKAELRTQREYDERKDLERLEREERKERIERRHTPHIELKIECRFFGPRQDQFLAEFAILARNQGQVVHQFPEVTLRVRGVKDKPFQYWPGREPRARFPHKLFEVDLVPPDWNFIFIEPGVSHQITFTTLISADYSYLLAHAEFDYQEYWPHTAETVFAVPEASVQ